MNNEKEIQTLKNQLNTLVYQLLKTNTILGRITTQLDFQEIRQLIAENLRILESLRSHHTQTQPSNHSRSLDAVQ